jgi:hypothetical protein
MRFAVDCDGGFLARGFDQAEDLSGGFVEPVPPIVHAILLLHFEVARVCARDGILGQTFDMLVNVYVEWHRHFSFHLVLIDDDSVASQWL